MRGGIIIGSLCLLAALGNAPLAIQGNAWCGFLSGYNLACGLLILLRERR
jgi:hypothetical protein